MINLCTKTWKSIKPDKNNLLLYLSYFCRWNYVKSVQIRNFFWSVFSRIWTEYGEIRRHFLRSVSRSKYLSTKLLQPSSMCFCSFSFCFVFFCRKLHKVQLTVDWRSASTYVCVVKQRSLLQKETLLHLRVKIISDLSGEFQKCV